MSRFSKYDPFSNDHFSKEGKSGGEEHSLRIAAPAQKAPLRTTPLFPLNETEEFHDPFSEINLFLARRIKREILREKNPKKWSRKIQSLLLKEILPDFSKKFPGYRLGSTALQKIWNKVLYYLQTIQQKKGALKPNGKLNIEYLIRENLKNLESLTADFHPYNTAHALAVKISECIAAIDGDRPNLDYLIQTIWSAQKHLLPCGKKLPKAPFDTIDPLDKLIVRLQMEELAKDPGLTYEDLAKRLLKRARQIQSLDRIKNLNQLTPTIYSLLAEKCYPFLTLHTLLSSEEIQTICTFIEEQLAKATPPSFVDEEKRQMMIATRIFFLYRIASQIPLDQIGKSLDAAIEYVYAISHGCLPTNTPVLKEEVYEFIDQELTYLKGEGIAQPHLELKKILTQLFKAAEKLPKIDPEYVFEIEIVIWKVISETTPSLAKLPSYIKRIIYDETAWAHIDHPYLTFRQIASLVQRNFKMLRKIDFCDLDKKVDLWAHQNAMVAANLYFDPESQLLSSLLTEYEQEKSHSLDIFAIDALIAKVQSQYTENHLHLQGWQDHLKTRITILFQYLWYGHLRKEDQSSFDRFVLFQYNLVATKQEKQFLELLLPELEMKFHKRIPLFPFAQDTCRQLISSDRVIVL